MKSILAFIGLVLLASTASGQPAPPSSVVLVACYAQDRTEFSEIERPVPNIHYKELRTNDRNEYDCQQVFMEDLTDKFSGEDGNFVSISDPSNITFADFSGCMRNGPYIATEWEQKNPRWLVVAVGCPIPILDDRGTPDDTSDDVIVSWKLPECPVYLPGTKNRMVCRFSKRDA